MLNVSKQDQMIIILRHRIAVNITGSSGGMAQDGCEQRAR